MPRSLPARHRARASLVLLAVAAGCAPRASAPPPPAVFLSIPEAPALPTLRDAMLASHRDARARVGLPPLEWNPDLAQDAQRWAEAIARTGRFEHEAQEREGENLWMGTRGAYRFAEMAGMWVAEKRNFVGPADPFASRTGRWEDIGHYSQIVWRGTTRLGCALASNHADDVLVCRYDPPGNVEGERAY